MSSRNQPAHFAKGFGQFTPWKNVTRRAREAATAQAKPGKFFYGIGKLVNGVFVPKPKKKLDIGMATR